MLNFNEPYFIRALVSVVFAAISCSVIGVILINMRLSFLGVCMSHSAFVGVLIGLLIGINPIICAFAVTLVAAGILGPISDKGKLAPDTAVGILFSSSLGIAFIIMKFLPVSNSEALGYLWGSILSMTDANVFALVLTGIITSLLLWIFYRYVIIFIFNRNLALTLGIPTRPIFYGIIIFCGLVTTVSLSTIGGLLVFSLILNPAAGASQLTNSIKIMFFIAMALAVTSGIVGILLAWVFDLPVGASVVIASTISYLICYIYNKKIKPLK